ncbi:MAG: UvrD-helicase domain-containing protein [Synergistaceae bacterium]|nr:UvrD-helicase domain-containing protein [Synergistaceae bacterium]
MTSEEKQQVQNLINARTKLLTEKAARQEEQIKSLSATIITLSNELDNRTIEIDELKSQLEQAKEDLYQSQEQNRQLLTLVQSEKTGEVKQAVPPEPSQKPNYLLSLLRQHFGFTSFRAGQEEIIDALLSGRDVFCSMPNHYGLSICYRLPALLMPGVTLAVTPDEPDAELIDSHSEILTSSLTPSKRREILRKVRNGTCKILYSTLNELSQDDSINVLKSSEISMTALLSRWGTSHNLEKWKPFISPLAKKRITAGIFADTTSPSLRNELLRLSDLHSPLKIVTGFGKTDRKIRIIKTENKPSALNEILSRKKGLAGIIYCSTPETVYKIRETLRDFDGLDDKLVIMPMVLYREIKRNDIRFTVHYDLPETLGDYSQHISLNGTDGSESECIVLASRNDFRNVERTVISFCNSDSPDEFLLSYLGEDEKFSGLPAKTSEKENITPKISPDDVSDFDFSGANGAQRDAITSTEGPVLIIAGPGTGKTFTLVQRAVFMIQKKHVKPESIMAASFTEKAAREFEARITEELSKRNITADTGSMYSGTFHSICCRILREYAGFTGDAKSGKKRRNFRILDDFDHAYIIMQNIKRFTDIDGLNGALKSSGKWANSCELRDYINTLTEELADPEELMRDSDSSVRALGRAVTVHDDILSENNSLSYSAILSETYKLLRDNPEILSDIQSRIKYIMIDEYQDTNYVQEQLAFMIAGNAKNICVAGDDDQSIYRFRGAAVRNILEFSGHFGENECRIVRLMLNYRSQPEIVKFFSEWITDTEKFFAWDSYRHDKKLEAFRTSSNEPAVLRLAGLNDKNEWREKILHFIRALKDSGKLTDYSQIAFLFRSVKTSDVQSLLQFLEENNINVYSPRSNMYFQRGEVQFAIGCMIGMFPEYMRALNSGSFAYRGSEPDYIAYYKKCLQNVTKYIERPAYSGLKKHLLEKRSFHGKLNGSAGYTYSDLLYELFAYMPFNRALSADISGTVKDLRPARNLAKLVQVIRKYEYSYNVRDIHGKCLANQFQMMMNIYLRFMIEDGLDEYEGGNEPVPSGHVSFMTIHQAKGMEFPIVFADSLWSSPQNDTNSDRNADLMENISANYYRRPEFEPSDRIKYFDFWRLYYVGFSRAQDLLILTCNEDKNTPSKFFEGVYDKLNDADESLDVSGITVSPSKNSGIKDTYSFTGDVLAYERCPLQYKFFRELEFMPGRSANTFMGTLIHAVLDEIHRAVINGGENLITEAQISEWFSLEYEHLSRTEQAYLTKSARETALSQIIRYVQRQGSDWSSLRRSEYEVKTVRGEYILEGKIDLISVRDGETEITDFKSGPKPNININSDRLRLENYRRQVFAYGWLLEQSSGLKVKRLRIYFIGENAGSPEILFEYDSDEAAKIMEGFDDVVRKISGKDFGHKANDIDTCSECVFRYYCGE